jgi:hypothetical protein
MFLASANRVVLTVFGHDNAASNQILFDDFVVTSSDSNTNLVENPGFESGGYSPGWFFVGQTNIFDRSKVTNKDPQTGTYAYSPSDYADNNGISQVLTTVPGTTYTCTFWVTVTDKLNSGHNIITVSVTDFNAPYNLALSPISACDTTMVPLSTITGYAASKEVVNVYLNGVIAGSTTSAADGTFTIQLSIPLTDGQNTITANAVMGTAFSGNSDPLNVVFHIPVAPTDLASPDLDSGFETPVKMPIITGKASSAQVRTNPCIVQ